MVAAIPIVPRHLHAACDVLRGLHVQPPSSKAATGGSPAALGAAVAAADRREANGAAAAAAAAPPRVPKAAWAGATAAEPPPPATGGGAAEALKVQAALGAFGGKGGRAGWNKIGASVKASAMLLRDLHEKREKAALEQAALEHALVTVQPTAGQGLAEALEKALEPKKVGTVKVRPRHHAAAVVVASPASSLAESPVDDGS